MKDEAIARVGDLVGGCDYPDCCIAVLQADRNLGRKLVVYQNPRRTEQTWRSDWRDCVPTGSSQARPMALVRNVQIFQNQFRHIHIKEIWANCNVS